LPSISKRAIPPYPAWEAPPPVPGSAEEIPQFLRKLVSFLSSLQNSLQVYFYALSRKVNFELVDRAGDSMFGTLDLTNGAVLIPSFPGDPDPPRDGELFLVSGRLRYRGSSFFFVAHQDEILEKVLVLTNQPVDAGAVSTNVTFTPAQPDTNYHVVATPSWNTTIYVTNKSTNGFTVNYGTAAPSGGGVVDISCWRLPVLPGGEAM
jgi:hypothetical protein